MNKTAATIQAIRPIPRRRVIPKYINPELDNVVFANGYSGHGLQQGPATGRGVSELILGGRYDTLDLSSLGWARVLENRPIVEKNVV